MSSIIQESDQISHSVMSNSLRPKVLQYMLQYNELLIHVNKDQEGIWIVVRKKKKCCSLYSPSPAKKKLKFTLKKMQVTSTKAISKASNRPLD